MHRPQLFAPALPALLALLSIAACADEAPPSPPAPPTLETPPGPAKAACAPGEALQPSGACLPAGVPADACAKGFTTDGAGGCVAVLPDPPCGYGQMATPGDAKCRDVATCAAGTWGDIPTEPTTRFVDIAYAGANGASDGSKDRPWTSVTDAINDAQEGAIVAVAAGAYPESITIQQKKGLRVWGACPGLVEITGAPGAPAIRVLKGADGAEIRDIAVRGDDGAALVSGSMGVLFERLWIHDSFGRGIEASDVLGKTSLTLRGSLIERVIEFGVIMAGVTTVIEDSEIRSISTAVDQTFGRGLSVQADPGTGRPSSATVSGLLVEETRDVAVFVLGSTLTLSGSVIRDTRTSPDKTMGRGLTIRSDPATKLRSTATVTGSIIERSHETGVLILGSDATIEDTVVRDTAPQGDMTGGRGVDIETDPETGERANATLRRSLIEKNVEFGVFVQAADALIESTIVRDTAADADGSSGAGGINVQINPYDLDRAAVTVRGSVVEKSHEMGIFVSGSDALIDSTVVRGTLAGVTGAFGRGINAQVQPGTKERSMVTVQGSFIEDSQEFGVLFLGSDGSLKDTIVRGTAARAMDASFGDGLAVAFFEGSEASCALTNSDIEESARAGVSNFGASVSIKASQVQCNPIALDGEALSGRDFAFEDLGGNECGCASVATTCKALSAKLAPPTY